MNESKASKIKNYNPSGVGINNGQLFGFPFSFEDAEVIALPVPWEVTTSFGSGTSKGPARLIEISPQLDTYHPDYPTAWHKGIYNLAIAEEIEQLNNKFKIKAQELILLQEKGVKQSELQAQIDKVNEACEYLRKWVFEQAQKVLNREKKLLLIGGDHSTPLGYLQALAQHHADFGILQIDAHADLRKAYEGFTYSHASIMYNAMQIGNISKLVQVGIRDICQEEVDLINNDDRIHCVYDWDIKRQQFDGKTTKAILEDIINYLPQKVYVSFDVDGLDPALCPNTGTPVPGGLSFNEAIEIIRLVKVSGREIIGADINEVGNDEWDANVAARIVYQLFCYM